MPSSSSWRVAHGLPRRSVFDVRLLGHGFPQFPRLCNAKDGEA